MKHEDLRILEELKQKGLITEEEYERRKEKMVSHRPAHTYHVEPNHKKELEKAQDAIQKHHTPLVYHHHTHHHHTSRKYHHGGTKSKWLAGLLGVFFGALGFHNFYLMHVGKAFAQLLTTFVCGSFTLYSGKMFILVPIVWGLVEGVLILIGLIDKDAHDIDLV